MRKKLWAALATAALLGGLGLSTTTAHAAATDVIINEIESQDAASGPDWIEVYNPGSTDADISGLIVKDDNDARNMPIPDGTIVPAGGYLQLVDGTHFDFGLGAADAARLVAADGTTLIDQFSWTAHAAQSYGRCPDGQASAAFIDTLTPTPDAPNSCPAVTDAIVINEVESSGGVPGDWVELRNLTAADVDISGFQFRDNDDARTAYTLPAGSIVAANGYLVLEEADFNFGLGGNDSARLYAADCSTLVDEYAWPTHATTTYGRCGLFDGWFTTASPTKGAANDCPASPSPIVINEIESNGGVPGDWVELYNPTISRIDISGWTFKDNDDLHVYTLPAGSSVESDGYLVLDEADFGFGLGQNGEMVRLWDAEGLLVDSHTWGPHAPVTLERCPNGTGDFVESAVSTKAAKNDCGGTEVEVPDDSEDPTTTVQPWPGPQEVSVVDPVDTFTGDLSGLDFDGPNVVYGVVNGDGTLFKLVPNNGGWTPAPGWELGKQVNYLTDEGQPDSEGVTVAGNGMVFVGTERNSLARTTSAMRIIGVDPSGEALVTFGEWDLTPLLPEVGANSGIEAIEWIADDAVGALGIDLAGYGPHYGGLFMIGIEGTGNLHAVLLGEDGSVEVLATYRSGFPGVMALDYDESLRLLWVVCDEVCDGQVTAFFLSASVLEPDTLIELASYARPTGMPNIANEGFAIAPAESCTLDGLRTVLWADDSDTDGYSLRAGAAAICARQVPTPDPDPEPDQGSDPAPTTIEQPGGQDGTADPRTDKPSRLPSTGSSSQIGAMSALTLAALAGLVANRIRRRA